MSTRWAAGTVKWVNARFRDCVLDRHRRELLKDGVHQPLEPKAFDVLVYMIEQRKRVVAKDDILADCYGGDAVSDGALARTVMKIRQAISDLDSEDPLIKTVHGVGYRFVGALQLGTAELETVRDTRAGAVTPAHTRRIVLLPFKNDTGEPSLSWVELGLMSLVGKALKSTADLSIVPAHDVIAALGRSTSDTSVEQQLPIVEARLGTRIVAWGRLSGAHGRFLLHFDLKAPEIGVLHGIVAGGDAAKMAIEAAVLMRQWLAPGETTAHKAELDLRDEFLNEAFARAVQHSRENRLIEAEHLLDVLGDTGVATPEVRYETAKVQVMLGRPHASANIQALHKAANLGGDRSLQATAHLLSATFFEQQGRLAEAAASLHQAVELADSSGLDDLAVRCMLACAGCLGAIFDSRAQVMLSQAIPRAEHLGNRALLAEAYFTAGRLATYRNDWISALRHHEMALSVARNLNGSVQFASSSLMAWTQLQLGQLDSALSLACEAFRVAQISGKRPDLGLTAMTAAHASIAGRRIPDALGLYWTMQSLDDDSLAMVLARDVHCRAPLLRATERFDEALSCVAAVSQQAEGAPIIRGHCDAARLQVLLQARRYDELVEVCASIRSASSELRDPRLLPWVERALALHECFCEGKVTVALDRLHEVVRSTPICEAHAVTALETAWLHLEQGHYEAAKNTVTHLPTWLEQTPSGMQVAARLRYESGDWHGAATIQRRFTLRCAESLTAFQRQLLQLYDQTALDGQRRDIAPLDCALDLHWQVEPRLLAELSPALGGAADNG